MKEKFTQENYKLYETLNQKYILLQKQYCNSFEKLNEEVLSKIYRYEYSKGGLNIHRGFYSPSSLDLVTGNCNKGKLLKVTPKKHNYDYEYIFDSEGRLICSKKFSDELNGAFSLIEVELFIYNHNNVLSLVYEPHNNYALSFISECQYSNEKILRYESAICELHYGGKGCTEINIENFEYSNNLLKSIIWQRYVPSIHLITQYKYTLFRDKDDYLSAYTVEEISQTESTNNKIEHLKKYNIKKRKK